MRDVVVEECVRSVGSNGMAIEGRERLIRAV